MITYVIDIAASVIRDDIQLSVYDLSKYPTMEDTENGDSLIPQSLKRFLHRLADLKDKQSFVVYRRCTDLAQANIPTSRLKFLISPLLFAIALYMHHKYASRHLIDILSGIGFDDYYKEEQRFENSLISSAEPSYCINYFTQFVFDNDAFIVVTLTGRNTLHVVGGTGCVTPPETEEPPIAHPVRAPSTELFAIFREIPSRHTESQ